MIVTKFNVGLPCKGKGDSGEEGGQGFLPFLLKKGYDKKCICNGVACRMSDSLTASYIPKFRRRWYDQDIQCMQLIQQIEGMLQPECREFCARVIIHFAEKLRKDILHKGRHTLSVSSIGASAISGLYNYGHRKRRSYDNDPLIHRTVGLLYSLPIEGLTVLGFKLGDTIGLIETYSMVCTYKGMGIDLTVLTRICTTALQAGKAEAEEMLIAIVGQSLYETVLDEVQPEE